MYSAPLKTIHLLFFKLALLGPASAQQTTGSDAQLTKRIDNYLTLSVERSFSGAVLVVEDNEIILSKGYGLANKKQNIPNTAQTVFDIGSLTKQFTGAAIVKLVEQGKLDVQDPLGKFFQDVPDDKKEITVHQLLTHTSGISSYTGRDYDFISREDFLTEVFGRKLKSNPGDTYSYANANFSLLAIILEQVSGQQYEAFLSEHLFQPAGMQSTGYLIPEWDDHVVAQGYDYSKNKHWGTNIERWAEDGGVSWHLKGNGGILSTVEDMYKWHVALEADKILPTALKATYEAPHADQGGGAHYGYGWVVRTTPDNKKILFHDGSNFYFFAIMGRFIDHGRVIIFMTNEARDDVNRMSPQIIRMLGQPDYEPELISAPSWRGRLQARWK